VNTRKPCRCDRYRFPHRYEARKCSRNIEYTEDQSAGRQYWSDYHDRVVDLRRELV